MDEEKIKITIRVSEETHTKCEEGMLLLGYTVRNDFIEKAIQFYSGYLAAQTHVDFLSGVIVETVRSTVVVTENRLARLLFKIAVELAKLEQMLAVINEMDEESIKKLHLRCVNEVKKINGILGMEEAMRFQKWENE